MQTTADGKTITYSSLVPSRPPLCDPHLRPKVVEKVPFLASPDIPCPHHPNSHRHLRHQKHRPSNGPWSHPLNPSLSQSCRLVSVDNLFPQLREPSWATLPRNVDLRQRISVPTILLMRSFCKMKRSVLSLRQPRTNMQILAPKLLRIPGILLGVDQSTIIWNDQHQGPNRDRTF